MNAGRVIPLGESKVKVVKETNDVKSHGLVAVFLQQKICQSFLDKSNNDKFIFLKLSE